MLITNLMKGILMDQTSNFIDRGKLQVRVNSSVGAIPVDNATVQISYSGDPASHVEQLSTNTSGQSEIIDLPTPPLEYSLTPSSNQPYAEYTIQVNAEGYEPATFTGSQILPNVMALQNVILTPVTSPGSQAESFVIGPHTLYGDYPPKIPEEEIKPINETGEIVLSRVVVPEFIIVHDGPVDDASAQNHYVRYRDYIKNVASCEIYATWPENSIMANVLAIMSFTLNRVYTEWYRNKGHNFTITSSTAYDHKWIPGKNIFNTIDRIVDSLFGNYLSRPGVRQPILTQYCDGKKVTCPNWLP